MKIRSNSNFFISEETKIENENKNELINVNKIKIWDLIPKNIFISLRKKEI